jgi:hypothetical protein
MANAAGEESIVGASIVKVEPLVATLLCGVAAACK